MYMGSIMREVGYLAILKMPKIKKTYKQQSYGSIHQKVDNDYNTTKMAINICTSTFNKVTIAINQ